ncbi:MAG TPA: hypothetical protein VKB73_10130 [Gaiellaceae bacterium]|nr:hypothetical protein [Gaiellaceae bacterium]
MLAFARPTGASAEGLLLLSLGGSGVLWVGVGLASRWSAALAVGIAFLGAEQGVRVGLGSSTVDPWMPVYAAGFLLAAELAWWSIEPRVAAWSDLEVLLRRLLAIVGCCIGGAILAALVVLAAGAPLHGGFGLELVGVVAAVAAVVVVAVVARAPAREHVPE